MINLCQYKDYSCFGCCGHHFEGKERVMLDIWKNTKELELVGNHRDVFRDRFDPKIIRSSGVCMNLTFIENRVGCPLHPSQNSGAEMRDSCCDKSHLCRTFFRFKFWDDRKKSAFLKFIDRKKLDSYEYSVRMDNGTLLEEFEKQY